MIGIEAESVAPVVTLAVTGVLLTAIFVALAYWIATRIHEPMKGLGLALAVWLFSTVLYDGLVLLVANEFWAYPLERPMLVLMMLVEMHGAQYQRHERYHDQHHIPQAQECPADASAEVHQPPRDQ